MGEFVIYFFGVFIGVVLLLGIRACFWELKKDCHIIKNYPNKRHKYLLGFSAKRKKTIIRFRTTFFETPIQFTNYRIDG